MDILSILIILMSICIAIIVFFSLIVFLYPGYDGRGFDKKGNHKNGTRYDDKGFDFFGYDKDGYSKSGFNRDGYDRDGYSKSGFNRDGYDREGYRVNGYSRSGYDRKGNYDRFFDIAAFDNGEISIDGFYDPKVFSISINPHAKERFQERMAITDELEMDYVATSAYRYGKTKRQLSKNDAYYMKRKAADHPGKFLILYEDFYYVFSQDNSLVTLFPRDNDYNSYDYLRWE